MVKRIGYLVSQYPAASHTFIMREVEALRARGLDITTYSVRPPSDDELSTPRNRAAFETTRYILPVKASALAGAHLSALVRRPGRYRRTFRLALAHRAPGLKAWLWALFHFVEAIQLARQLDRDGIDHLHNHFANAGATVGLLATQFLGLPWSLTLHGISETDYPAGLLLPDKLRHARFAACVSWFGRAQVMRTTPSSEWGKLHIVRCGLDLSLLPEGSPAERSRPRIICVGRLSAEKGHLGLLDAVAMLKARGRAAELALVGDGPERALIERHVAALGLADDVTFLGRLPEEATLAEIGRSDLLVLPSFMEGLPIVLMEAMALGVPVVASHVAGVPELVEDKVAGLLFTPSNWHDLTDKLETLLVDEPLRGSVRAAGRTKVEAEFEIGRAVAPLVDLFG